MKKLFLFLIVTSVLYGMQIEDDPSFKVIFKNKQNIEKTVLMFYSAKTCPQCAYMKQKVFKNKEVKNFMDKYIVILEKDINKDDLPKGFEYFGIPTMFFINNNGEKIGKIVGSSRAKPFLEQLKKIVVQ